VECYGAGSHDLVSCRQLNRRPRPAPRTGTPVFPGLVLGLPVHTNTCGPGGSSAQLPPGAVRPMHRRRHERAALLDLVVQDYSYTNLISFLTARPSTPTNNMPNPADVRQAHSCGSLTATRVGTDYDRQSATVRLGRPGTARSCLTDLSGQHRTLNNTFSVIENSGSTTGLNPLPHTSQHFSSSQQAQPRTAPFATISSYAIQGARRSNVTTSSTTFQLPPSSPRPTRVRVLGTWPARRATPGNTTAVCLYGNRFPSSTTRSARSRQHL